MIDDYFLWHYCKQYIVANYFCKHKSKSKRRQVGCELSGCRESNEHALFQGHIAFNVAYLAHLVFGLTVDWVNKNLYWTDAVYNWIAMAAIDDPTSFRFIIEGSLHSPHGIAVHPGSRSKIESMHISGQQRRVEVAENIVSTFVSFDALQQTLLIAVIDLDSAFVYNDSSGSLGDRRLFHNNIINKTDDVMIYNPAKQPPLPENPCASKNCEHMCIATSDNAAECLCNHLHELQDDENYVGGDPHKLYTTEVPMGVIGVDHHNEMMYFSSTNHIYAVGMRDGMYPSVRVQLLDVDVEIGGLAVDWLAHRLYWTNVGEKSITHSTLHGNEMKSIIRDRNGLQGIVVNALTKTIYWTEAYEDTGAILTSDVDVSGFKLNRLPIKSLAVQQDYLVWTSRAANESGVYWKRRELHSVVQHYEPVEEAGDIKVFWHSQSPVTERGSSKLPVTIGAIAGGVVLVIIIVGIIVFVVRHQKTSENQPREPMHPMSIPDNPDYEHIRESQIDADVHAYEIPNATFNDTFSEVNSINAVQQRY
ncbi:hypothetical protein CAPTEDRAFT_210649 [Capitella teleta]|uniref:EGF-like domain-containing protein n=1 Tax=Capitella teleta TaxID=283909 RepID=R7UFI5_CAPTE|nr:hypothetical protein CAPTEDRAFT_210649 [Capitella teleta]|eukprot:ELU04975.1 hypothetical protein CAPTEDRAFT_210649 [Capitella teleta]